MKKRKAHLKHAAPTVLSIIGAVGVVITAVSSAKVTPKALEVLEKEEKEKQKKLTKYEKFYFAAPIYIPTVLFGGFTIGCIFGANILNKKQQASLISAYALVNESYRRFGYEEKA